MENRWSTRKPVTGTVVVDSPRLGKIRSTLCDISLGGALVETGNITLPLNSPVSVAFNLLTGDHRGDYRLHAVVVRRSLAGAGLLFQDLDTETIRSLRAILYDPSASSTPSSSPSPAWSGAWTSRVV